MKTVIAGSRNITDYSILKNVIDNWKYKDSITEIISGGAKGVDTLGESYACLRNLKLTRVLPDWEQYGKKAGMIRNKIMVDMADLAVILWDGVSPGTKCTIDLVKKKNIPYILSIVK